MDNDFTPKEAVRVKRFFSQEELDEKRKTQTNRSIELDDIEDEIKALKQQYALKIKDIKSMCKGIRGEIKLGYENIERMCYCIPKVQRDFVNADDYKGTAAIEKITKIEHEIPLSFQLNIPIFTGGAHKTFTVNINITATDGGISFWFESVDMHEIISRETDSIFSLELDRLSNFLVVKQW